MRYDGVLSKRDRRAAGAARAPTIKPAGGRGRCNGMDACRPGRRWRRLSWVVTLAAAGAPAAQGIVPASMAGREGGSSTAIPFGLAQPARIQCLYDAEELPWTGPRLLQSLALRADNDQPGTTSFPLKQYLIVHVQMSTAARRSDEASSTFADNHGADATFVAAGLRLSLPGQPPSPTAPRPCDVRIPFSQQPFFYDLSPVRGPRTHRPGLVVDLRIELQPAGDYRLDSPLQCASTITPFGRLGPACLTGRGLPLTITPNASIKAGDRVTYTVENMMAGALFAVVLGAQPGTGTWGALPLPYALAPHGAPDCWINTEWLAVTPGIADAGGRGQASYPLPANRFLVHRALHAQALCRDLTANPFLHVTSLGVSATVCGPLGVARVSALGDWQARTGAVSFGTSYIIELQ